MIDTVISGTTVHAKSARVVYHDNHDTIAPHTSAMISLGDGLSHTINIFLPLGGRIAEQENKP